MTLVACGSTGREDDQFSSGATNPGADATGGANDTAPEGDDAGVDGDGPRLDVGTPDPDTGGGAVSDCESAAETQSNLGCEFWAVDLPNISDVDAW